MSIVLLIITSFFCILQGYTFSYCSVKKETTRIVYYYHTNSGEARYTSVTIEPDSLTWNYNEARNDVKLKDMVRYDKKEYQELINNLSQITFLISGSADISVGGAGYSYYFYIGDDDYLSFDKTLITSGNCQKVVSMIKCFIANHQTRCEQLFWKYSAEPHRRGQFGEFETLPDELENYRVK